MMDSSLLHLIAQVPIVGLFVWFVLQNNAEWRKYLESHAQQEARLLEALTNEVKSLSQLMNRQKELLLAYYAAVKSVKEDEG